MHIPKFKNQLLQQIADDCGLVIDPSNLEVTQREIEFFAEKVLEYTKEGDWIKCDGLIPNIPENVTIQVKFRDYTTEVGKVNHWSSCWRHDDMPEDIIEYRILDAK